MFTPDQYELVDFGGGRKLERIAGELFDRPSPAAEAFAVASAAAWNSVEFRFEVEPNRSGPERGRWTRHAEDPKRIRYVQHGPVTFEIGFTPFGHIGLFLEQAANWDWLADQCTRFEEPRVLNLFAYTGGSTLAAAAAGARVTHVDAAKSSVEWARRNAGHSGLDDAPIRWIVDDAVKFATREVRRGRRYEGIVLDPPSYGHGAGKEVWRFDENLPELLSICGELLTDDGFALLTCHTPAWDDRRLRGALEQAMPSRAMRFSGGPMVIEAADGRELPSGVYVHSVA